MKWELRKVMQSMGKCPSEEELLMMIMEVDEDGSGAIEFAEVRDETDRSKLLTVCKVLLLLWLCHALHPRRGKGCAGDPGTSGCNARPSLRPSPSFSLFFIFLTHSL